jgi:hypothetical protein
MGAILGGLVGIGVAELDRHLALPDYFQYSSSTAGTLLTAVVGAAAALVGFVVTVATLMDSCGRARPASSRRST